MKEKKSNKYLKSADILNIDKKATIIHNISPLILMESAGKSVADFISHRYKKCEVYCLIGRGNNGGDGLVIARHLYYLGYGVTVIRLFENVLLKKESPILMNLNILRTLKKIKYSTNLKLLMKARQNSIVIDAIYGIGLSRKLSLSDCVTIDFINDMSRNLLLNVISVDIPSGLNPDTGIPNPLAIEADYTITMGFMKKGFKNPVSSLFTGKVI
ncbi:MAG: NAD(P)H-hydrate epimerase, partial [Planctomycetes bacterium]|nr:NAD(P)H-hydrate epimerase [Planctomycetota bacterium]